MHSAAFGSLRNAWHAKFCYTMRRSETLEVPQRLFFLRVLCARRKEVPLCANVFATFWSWNLSSSCYLQHSDAKMSHSHCAYRMLKLSLAVHLHRFGTQIQHVCFLHVVSMLTHVYTCLHMFTHLHHTCSILTEKNFFLHPCSCSKLKSAMPWCFYFSSPLFSLNPLLFLLVVVMAALSLLLIGLGPWLWLLCCSSSLPSSVLPFPLTIITPEHAVRS